MKLTIVFLTLFLYSCGSSTVTVSYHEVTQAELASMCEEPYICGGFAEWDDIAGTCDIYMKPVNAYFTEDEYHMVLGHEMRHCLVGEFH